MDCAAAIITAFTTGKLGDEFADDVVFDLNVPQWRFQLKGRRAVEEHFAEEMTTEAELLDARVLPAEGFTVVELVLRDPDSDQFSREVAIAHGYGGLITAVTLYCTGMWDKALVRRHAAEAPMITNGYVGPAL